MCSADVQERLSKVLTTRHAPVIAAIATFVLATAVFLLRAERQIGLDAVPGPGDEAEYDLLAMEIAAGHGFRFDYDNPEWRRPYVEANVDGSYDDLLARSGASPTTYRPPLFPAIVAGIYSLFGRSFEAVRIVNCVLMALAGAMAAWLVARRIGLGAGLLCGFLFAVVEHRARYHAGLILTESLASLLAVVLTAVLIQFGETRRLRHVALAGLFFGVAVLNRPLIFLWLPFVVLLVAWLIPQRKAAAIATLCLVAFGVIMPWSIRNSLLLGRPSLLGTHGQQNLSAAYSDKAVELKGLWFRLDEGGFFPSAIDDTQPGIAREIARAELSQRTALEWIQDNPLKVPLLAVMRVWQLWQPRMHWDALFLGLTVLGFVCWPNTLERRVFAAILLSNTAAVAVTWSVGGRFLVPILPIVMILSVNGAVMAFRAAREDHALTPSPSASKVA